MEPTIIKAWHRAGDEYEAVDANGDVVAGAWRSRQDRHWVWWVADDVRDNRGYEETLRGAKAAAVLALAREA